MKNQKYLVFSLLIVLVFCFAVPGWAFGGRPGKGGRPGPDINKFAEKLAKELGLSEDQKVGFIERGEKVEKEMKAFRVENKQLREKIEKELLKDLPDEKTVEFNLHQISNNDAKMHFKRLQHMIEFKKGLSKEQRQKMQDMLKDRKGFLKHRKESKAGKRRSHD